MTASMTNASIKSASRYGASEATAELASVSEAKADLDNVTLFTKFIKKAEETAQSAI